VELKEKPNIILLRPSLPHISRYSGYENFSRRLNQENLKYIEIFSQKSLKRNDFLKRFYITRRNKNKVKKIGPYYSIFSYLAEMETAKVVMRSNVKIVHNTSLEDNHGFLGLYKKKYRFTLIATPHQPVSWWKYIKKSSDCLSDLDLLIALSEFEKDYFENFIPGKVRLIHHGVDTDFFNIIKPIENRQYRLLFVGNWLRDLDFLETVISRLLNTSKEIKVDIVHSKTDLCSPIFKLCRYPQINVHRNITDEQLRSLYNESRLLFLPLIDSTANNTLLEASACGVPIITTNLPAVKEYTHDSFAYYYLSAKDCVEQILESIKDDVLLKCRSRNARNFMELNFSLEKIAREHANIYREFL
jgi:glycosyltransferase involved in cell wall biosynthesis